MSAFVVSSAHISGMLCAAAWVAMGDRFSYFYNGKWITPSSPPMLGQLLLDENYRSVNYRYESDESGKFRYNPIVICTPVEVVKLCDSYQYQACETDDWMDTEAWAVYHALRERAINRLPGYEQAPWTI